MKVYAIIGQSQQTVLTDNVTYTPAPNEVLMVGERPEGNYIATEDGTWTAPTPTTEEQIAALDEQYAADKNELMQYFLQAVIDNDTATQTEIKSELAALAAAYDADLAELEGEE